MITCKKCHKFASISSVIINGFDEFIVVGRCGHCKVDERPLANIMLKEKALILQMDIRSNIDYDDFEELGIDR